MTNHFKEFNTIQTISINTKLNTMKGLFIGLMLFASCTAKDNLTHENSINSNLDSLKTFLETESKIFGFSVDKSLIFEVTKIKSFDTSLVLLLERGPDNKISGKIIYYPPIYYSSIYQWDTGIFICKTILFPVSPTKWKNIDSAINNKSKYLIMRDKSQVEKSTHPIVLRVFNGSKMLENTDYSDEYFEEIYEIINTELLKPAFEYSRNTENLMLGKE